ncbi:MAG: sigma-54 factor interaction domain-containing protein, partial [Actinobacteria bacterium]|nr:sigma-54 factor interaction domain-containing protein [Actinomycetota bacterium]
MLKHKYFVVEKIKGNLNNDGDVIVLRDAGKNLVDKVAYGNWDDGQAKDNAPAAKDPKSGLIEETDGGTIFLDEIGDMPMTMQVKLLRVMQEKELLR